MYWFNKIFEQNNKKIANNDISIVMIMQKKNTKLVLTPEPFYHNDRLIIINGCRFYYFIDHFPFNHQTRDWAT